MIVSSFMHKNPVTIQESQTVHDLVKLIFSTNVSGVPVLKDKKVVGIVTEEDILHRLFPTVKEVMEDYVHARSFDFVKERLGEMMNITVGKLMTKPVVTVKGDMPIMKALSLIILNKFSHIPVVNEDKEIIGMVSQGDIFKAITKQI